MVLARVPVEVVVEAGELEGMKADHKVETPAWGLGQNHLPGQLLAGHPQCRPWAGSCSFLPPPPHGQQLTCA